MLSRADEFRNAVKALQAIGYSQSEARKISLAGPKFKGFEPTEDLMRKVDFKDVDKVLSSAYRKRIQYDKATKRSFVEVDSEQIELISN